MPSPIRLATALIACLLAVACGSRHGPADGVVVHTQSRSPATPVPGVADTRPAPPAQSLTKPEAISDGESVGDASFSISPIARAVAAASPMPAPAIPSRWVENTHYKTLVPAQPTSVSPGKVEVVEVFWYGCPHCFKFDPALETWRKSAKPAYVEFRRMPVLWPDNPVYRSHARLYFTLESLGKLDALHSTVFQEIHVNHNPMVDPTDPARTEAMQKAFLLAHGVSEEQFTGTYRVPATNDRLERAEAYTERHKITGVPTMIVAGKYLTDIGMAGSEADLLALVNDLAASERRR